MALAALLFGIEHAALRHPRGLVAIGQADILRRGACQAAPKHFGW